MSAVLTVYNKAAFLPATIRSLRRQMADERLVEYVFVDDASSDDSLEVIRRATAGAPHLQVIANQNNRGPSIRLNQGGRAARGSYLYFLDADDIAAKGAMAGMLELLERETADLIYGRARKCNAAPEDLLDLALDPNAPCTVSDAPLAYIMKGGFTRMALMCRRDLFLLAGGADEHIFVQDESLPLRLAAHARRFIDWPAVVVSMPSRSGCPDRGAPPSRVSSDPTQLHHDAFLAHVNALQAFGESHPDLAPKLYARAVSAYWKYARRQTRLAWLHPGFWRYLEAKCLQPPPRGNVLGWMRAELAALPRIRRLP